MKTPRHSDDAGPTFASELPNGSLIAIDGVEHLVLAALGDLLMLVSVVSHHVYLVQDDAGCIMLPDRRRIGELLASGRAEIPAPAERTTGADLERLRTELTMLDAAGVPNGVKAIAIHLHRSWTPDLIARFGPHDEPATIRRWRTEARRPVAAEASRGADRA